MQARLSCNNPKQLGFTPYQVHFILARVKNLKTMGTYQPLQRLRGVSIYMLMNTKREAILGFLKYSFWIAFERNF